MAYRLILSPDAQEEVQSVLLWYLQHDIDLPFRFSAEFTATLNRIARTPYQFLRVSDRLWRAVMNRFPYLIYFTTSRDTVYVVMVIHQRRLNPLHTP